MTKKEIVVSRKDVWIVSLIFMIPLVSTFLLQHLGEFNYTYINGGRILEVEMNSLTFTTPFGNEETYGISEQGVRLERVEDGSYALNPRYIQKLPYYFKGFLLDIYIPIFTSFFLFVFYLLSKKIKIKIQ